MSLMYKGFKGVKIKLGNVNCQAYPVNWTLRDSTEHLPRLDVEYIIPGEVSIGVSNDDLPEPKNLYSLVYLGCGIIVFCLIWSGI